jgi:malonyl-CoA/methylmalonyl-CoA synthetase
VGVIGLPAQTKKSESKTWTSTTSLLPLSILNLTVFRNDRSAYVPLHRGVNVLPNCALFGRLIRAAHKAGKIAVKDLRTGISATHAQLLTDVLYVRNFLQDSLDDSTLQSLERNEEVYLNVLGPGGYEYTVAFLAVVALGAVVVPLCLFLHISLMFVY